ncbi:arginase family protein [Rathayibacter sp. YIM 133350]|uniref:arginase family protein n=1 Tax=Rathayibacter sp. YIM 133350 TaxID=3131992 RepID=UPI00307E5161
MPATFVVVPEWQGSISARAMRLIDGAEAIRGDLPSSATRLVDVPVGAGESLDTGVRRYSSVLHIKQNLLAELSGVDGTALTIGGDCAVSLGAIEHSLAAHPDAAVLWFDAHPDLNTPESSPSGAFNGMVLRTLMGEGAEGLVPPAGQRVSSERLVLAGIRDVDPAEAEVIAERSIPCLDVDRLGDADALLEALAATGASEVYVHVDLDVLDPAVIEGLDYPLPFGLTVEALTSLIAAVRARFTLVGATIAGFSPATPEAAADDLPSILRLISALTRG